MISAVLFSIWFYTLALLYSAVSIPLLSLFVCLCRPIVGHRGTMRLFRRCISVWGKIIVTILAYPSIRIRFRDLSKKTEMAPFVYVCNHRSSSDPFLVSLLAVEIVQVVNLWPFRLPVLGLYAGLAGYIGIREMSFDVFKKKVCEYLEQGVSIVAFPEGTRSASRRIGQFHGALFRACLEFGATIVPVCIMGNEDKPRRGSLLLHPGVVRMHRLPGIRFNEYKRMTPFALKNHIHGVIEDHIRQTEGYDDQADERHGDCVQDARAS